MKEYKAFLVEERDGVLILTINRPQALNALNNQVFLDLIQLFDLDITPADYKGVVITGSGEKAFAAGADIKEFSGLDDISAMRMSKRGQDIFATIESFPIPVIAAVNGFALGGGCELAMACHMRVGHIKSKFGQPEVNLGILPGYGGTQRLIQLIGKGKATELLLTGDMIGGEEAHRLGLLNQLCEKGSEVEAAIEMINKIAQKAPMAITETIKVINAYYDKSKNGYEEEVKAFGLLALTDDFKEGASAFVEKRKPNWKSK